MRALLIPCECFKTAPKMTLPFFHTVHTPLGTTIHMPGAGQGGKRRSMGCQERCRGTRQGRIRTDGWGRGQGPKIVKICILKTIGQNGSRGGGAIDRFSSPKFRQWCQGCFVGIEDTSGGIDDTSGGIEETSGHRGNFGGIEETSGASGKLRGCQ